MNASGSGQETDRGYPARKPFAIVDIGSNSVRLVVYDGLIRNPVPIFNEKVLCGLGRGLERTKRLHEEGVRMALATLSRFVEIAPGIGIDRLNILATAAVRDALDGAEFVAEVEARCQGPVQIVTGAEEARLSALGVLCGLPEADGMTGDIGGGSVELTMLERGTAGPWTTLPLGPLRLLEMDGTKVQRHIDSLLAKLPWLADCRGRTFYPVGGAWRALARIHIAQTNYPLSVIDHYAMSGTQAEELSGVIARMSLKSLEKLPRVPKRRLDTLPLAALVMRRLLKYAQPARLVFSAQGLREGYYFSQLPDSEQRRDPLIATCTDLALRFGRPHVHKGDPLANATHMANWMAPLFPYEDAEMRKLRLAACLLGDIAWSEHPDYRADQSYSDILRLPFLGSDHRSRAFLAYAVFTRYRGDIDMPEVGPGPGALLDEAMSRQSLVTGLAMKLAYVLYGGPATLLSHSPLVLDPQDMVFTVTKAVEPYMGEAVERCVDRLAKAVWRKPAILRVEG